MSFAPWIALDQEVRTAKSGAAKPKLPDLRRAVVDLKKR